ncbi:MAG: VIT and VWA domain-containing protein [Pyrinomonadaceae bacterium]
MNKTLIKSNLLNLFLSLSAILIAAFSVSAQEYADKTLSPYFFVSGDPTIDRLPLKDTRVQINVSGVIADVRVTQVYRNEGVRPINATYMFPASTRAAVYAMRMKVGNQIIYTKIKEREQAKKDFEAAKKEGKSASLLEENRPNVFSMKLANVMPQDQIEIELRYTELLVPTDGEYQVVYPTVVGPRYPSGGKESSGGKAVNAPYLRSGEKPTSELHITTRIAAGVPIAELSCTSHQITPQWETASLANLRLDDADPFQGNRDFVLRYRLAGDQINTGMLLFKGEQEGENFFLYMAQPPKRVAPEQIPPREYVFVVDVSGSMEGFPLNTSKRLLQDLIGNLRPTDLFNVILFSGDSTSLSKTPLAANQENIDRAIALIDQQRGAGGTELLQAVQHAMGLNRAPGVSRSLVLITDGYISGEQETFAYIRDHLSGCNVFAFGIGSSVNRYLIEGVAKAGMGEPFILENEAMAEHTAARFREYVQSPVLTDISIRSNGFETYDVFPKHVPDLLAGRPVIIFGKWRGTPAGSIELRGISGGGDYAASFDVAQAQPDDANLALRYLWARSRIDELSDYGAYSHNEEQVKQITALGLKYGLLTPFTSFIAVHEVIRNPNGDATEVDQPLPMPIGVTDLAIGSEPELIWLLAGLALVAMALVIHFRLTDKAGLKELGG